MTDATVTFIDPKRLSKRAVRRFFDAFEQRESLSESLSDDNEGFEGDGIALMIGTEVHGLYRYKPFTSLQADATLYFPYGGTLIPNRHTSLHQALIEKLILELKTDSKADLIICLDRQPMQQSDRIVEDEAFWLALGFSPLDVQIFYQGEVKYENTQDNSGFLVSKYEGGNDAINKQLCRMYREAYKGRVGIPDITSDSINMQLSIPSCSYLIMHHNDQLIGQVTLFISDRECYVDSIYVTRSYWGTGAADTLTRSLFDYAKTKECRTVSGTAASNNQASRALMERFGLVAQYQVKRMSLSI